MGSGYVEALLAKHRSHGVVLDTNLMLLYIVGIYDPRRISTFKRTVTYDAEDFYLLKRLMAYFQRKITTPNIVTEVDNLARQLPATEHEKIAGVLTALCSTMFEVYTQSAMATSRDLYSVIGLTDLLTAQLAEQKYLIITDDFRLASRLTAMRLDVVNMNHIRTIQ